MQVLPQQVLGWDLGLCRQPRPSMRLVQPAGVSGLGEVDGWLLSWWVKWAASRCGLKTEKILDSRGKETIDTLPPFYFFKSGKQPVMNCKKKFVGYVCVSVYVSVWRCLCICTCLCVYMSVGMYMSLCVRMSLCMYMSVCTNLYMSICVYMSMYVHVSACTCLCVDMSVYAFYRTLSQLCKLKTDLKQLLSSLTLPHKTLTYFGVLVTVTWYNAYHP